MKIKNILCFILVWCILLCTQSSFAYEADLNIYVTAENISGTRINLQKISGEDMFLLPSAIKAEGVMFFFEGGKVTVEGELKKETISSGHKINLNDFCRKDDYKVKFSRGGKDIYARILFSENIPAVFITSENPVEKGREWVEASPDKSNKATGSIVIQKENGEIQYSGRLAQIKGRGNSTWTEVKKPYQIKTEESVDLLFTGNDENKSKTWVLLANYLDESLLNNSYALKIGEALGMRSNVEFMHIDLYYDGEYRGNYLLAEKVEVGSGRVNIANLEEKNASANLNTDISKLSVKEKTTENGVTFTYCDKMKSPEDVTGGYLLEMDYAVRAKEEVCWFRTKRGQYVVVKSPEFASEEEMEYISSYYQEYEDAVYNSGVNPVTGKDYSYYVDKESVANYYIINELSKARDFFSSSAYLMKNAGEDKLYMGPLWDYDLGFGKSRYTEKTEEPGKGVSIYNTDFGTELIGIKDFAELVNDIYISKVYPLVIKITEDKNTISEDGVNSVEYEKEHIRKSAECNSAMWYGGKDWNKEPDNLKAFLLDRAEFLKEAFFAYAQKTDDEELYRDVWKTDSFYYGVSEAKRLGYMKGVDDNYFDPYATVRRSEVAQVLFNMANGQVPTYSQIFSDVKSSDWFMPSVIWATSEKLVNGFSDGEFKHSKNISREEFAAILYRFAKNPVVKDNATEISDIDSVSFYASDAVIWAAENGILEKDFAGKINPQGTITRAEMAESLVVFNERGNK